MRKDTKKQGSERGRKERRWAAVGTEGGVSFYGALNSDEVARSIPEDPNYPGTDKQTAVCGDEAEGTSEGGRGKTGRRHF